MNYIPEIIIVTIFIAGMTWIFWPDKPDKKEKPHRQPPEKEKKPEPIEEMRPEVIKVCELIRIGDYRKSFFDNATKFEFASADNLNVRIINRRVYVHCGILSGYEDKWMIGVGPVEDYLNDSENKELMSVFKELSQIEESNKQKERAVTVSKFLAYAPSSPKKPTPKKRKK